MSEIDRNEAITAARGAIGLDQSVAARAWRVRRLDRPGESYFLVIFGTDDASVGIVAADAVTGEMLVSAALSGTGPHSLLDARDAVAAAGLDGLTTYELVWRPCQATRSMLYPLWRIEGAGREVYVDQSGKVWNELATGGPGG